MTLENYKYRTDPLFLRNQFKGAGEYNIPIIPKAEFSDDDFDDLLLIGFDRIKFDDTALLDRMVHFFLYDYKFERVWQKPDHDIEKLKKYKAVLSPDFSMYLEMNPTLQLYNTFRNRWCGAYFASKGIKVIPTVSWGDENTFDFCFSGIPKGSTVAISTYMVSAHNNHADQKDFFLKGYNEMLRRIEPERIICYNQPFPEMQGNIVFVDYDLSSWKYQNREYEPSKYAQYICGELPLPSDSDIIVKKGYVLPVCEEKGMGSAYGGKWVPKKKEDERLIGIPGEIKSTIVKGDRFDTKIGDDGYATKERHYTDHNLPHAHTNPHDHIITWEGNHPNFIGPFNYSDDVPEFKNYGGINMGNSTVINIDPEDRKFESISDFKFSVEYGAEVEFSWKGSQYGIFKYMKKTPDSKEQILIAEVGKPDKDVYVDTVDEVLEYRVGNDRLRDIVTQIEVNWRNI